MRIIPWTQENNLEIDQLKEIFYLNSSRKSFSSAKEKEEFFAGWVGYYLNNWPKEVFLTLNNDNKIIGYLTGCSNSEYALLDISAKVPSFAIFSDWFAQYPAHLHINTHPDFIGKGIGTQLINRYVQYLRKQEISGMHIVTSPKAKNVGFYLKCGFQILDIRLWADSYPLQLMGLQLH